MINGAKVIDGIVTDIHVLEVIEAGYVECPEWVNIGDRIDKERPGPTKAEKIKAVELAVQAHLDAPAKALGYDDIKSACGYVDDEDPIFSAQGRAFKLWRSRTWRMCYRILDDVEARTRTEPTIAELMAELPVLVLPT